MRIILFCTLGIIERMVATSVGGVKLGQVAALSFDSFGNLIILHRGSRVWDSMYSGFSLNRLMTFFLSVFCR